MEWLGDVLAGMGIKKAPPQTQEEQPVAAPEASEHSLAAEPGNGSQESAPLADLNSEALRGAIQALLKQCQINGERIREVRIGGKSVNTQGVLLAIFQDQTLVMKSLAFVVDELLFLRTGRHELQVRKAAEKDGGDGAIVS
jgi:hypothetical protein